MKPPPVETVSVATEAGEEESLLLACPLFVPLNREELSFLAGTVESIDASPGEVLFREGEAGESLFVIVSGSVRLSTNGSSLLERPVALLGPGACFGEMGVLDGEPRSATATAARESRLLRVSRADLETLFRAHPGSLERLLREGVRLVSSRLRAANERYWSLAGSSLELKADMAQSRSRLLALVSHEFRTPLTIIKCSAQLLNRPGPIPLSALVGKILIQSESLEVLLDDLITLAVLQAGSRVSMMNELDLDETAAEVASEMSKAAQAKGLRLRCDAVEGRSTAILGDEMLLRRAVRHLVDNAIRFSTPPGEVQIRTEASADRVSLSVRDQGKGIDHEAVSRLLLSFVQQQDPLNRDADGLGIGLALVTEVARAHGGRILVESTPGSGSCFTMELARSPATSLGTKEDP